MSLKFTCESLQVSQYIWKDSVRRSAEKEIDWMCRITHASNNACIKTKVNITVTFIAPHINTRIDSNCLLLLLFFFACNLICRSHLASILQSPWTHCHRVIVYKLKPDTWWKKHEIVRVNSSGLAVTRVAEGGEKKGAEEWREESGWSGWGDDDSKQKLGTGWQVD